MAENGPCSCGCAALSAVSDEAACRCGCACGAPASNREHEIAELRRLLDWVAERLADLEAR